jgi:hypothetical protein
LNWFVEIMCAPQCRSIRACGSWSPEAVSRVGVRARRRARGHEAVVLERDDVRAAESPTARSTSRARNPALPAAARVPAARAADPDGHGAGRARRAARGRRDPQDVSEQLSGPREPGDEDLVYLWVRRR